MIHARGTPNMVETNADKSELHKDNLMALESEISAKRLCHGTLVSNATSGAITSNAAKVAINLVAKPNLISNQSPYSAKSAERRGIGDIS